MVSNREKSNIAIAILEKLPFAKIISHFDGSNNMFVDCTLTYDISIIFDDQTMFIKCFFSSGLYVIFDLIIEL